VFGFVAMLLLVAYVAATKRFPWREVPQYWAAQVLYTGPVLVPVWVTGAASTALAIPKSVIFT